MKPKLENVTLVCVDCVNYGEALTAIRKSMYQIDFARVIFLTDIKAYNPNFPFEIIKIDKISSKAEFSHFIFKKLASYITTEYVLIIHADGYVIDGNAWDDEFLKYDYLGSPWLYPEGRNVGNGVSLRTKRLLDILASDDFMNVTHPEDDSICRLYGEYLEKKYDIKFAPEDIADKFGYELREPTQSTFLFHGNFHPSFRPPVIVKRDGALGDIIAAEPLLEHLHNTGHNVIIDMPVHLCMFYGAHFYPVKHISRVDGRVLDKARVIDLNGSYENDPIRQNHLKSYYKTAGIEDGEVKNPRLKFPINEYNRLFKKYCVLHVAKRDQEQRNIHGIDWDAMVAFIKGLGYDVIQLGLTENEEIEGAIEMTTQTTQLMLYVVAGASFMIGIDSSVANMAASVNIPAIVFFGSVNPEHIYPDTSNMLLIHRHDEKVCDKPFCWADKIGSVTGTDCYIDNDNPPCTQYNHDVVLNKVSTFLKEKGL